MSFLIYCVLNGRRGPARPSVRGVSNRPVWVLECGGLCAAVSEAQPQSDSAIRQPDVNPAHLDELLAYV